MTDPKFNPEDEIPVEELEQASGAGIPVQGTENRSPAHEERRDTDQASNEPDPWKVKPT